MRSVGGGIVIEVTTIGVGEIGFNVETFWMGGDVIRVSMMRFRAKAFIEEMC